MVSGARSKTYWWSPQHPDKQKKCWQLLYFARLPHRWDGHLTKRNRWPFLLVRVFGMLLNSAFPIYKYMSKWENTSSKKNLFLPPPRHLPLSIIQFLVHFSHFLLHNLSFWYVIAHCYGLTFPDTLHIIIC